MTPYEILLSESQERMLLVAKPGCEQKVHDILAKWDLHAATIGFVTDTGRMVVKENGKVVADVPADSLTEAPVYHPAKSEPAILKKHREFDEGAVSVPKDLGNVLEQLLSDPDNRQQALGLPAIRPYGSFQYIGSSRFGRGGPQGKGHFLGAGHDH